MDDRAARERREEEERRALENAVRALRRVTGDVDDETAADRDRVAERLFDHARRFEHDEFLDLVTDLCIHELDELAREHCLREFLFLDPHRLAEEAVVKLSMDRLLGRRARPFPRWAMRAIREVAYTAVAEDAMLLFPAGPDATPRERIMAALAAVSNRMPPSSRRIVWLSFVERLGVRVIAEAVGQPIEHVEAVLQRTLRRAHRAVAGLDALSGDDGDPSEDDREDDGHV